MRGSAGLFPNQRSKGKPCKKYPNRQEVNTTLMQCHVRCMNKRGWARIAVSRILHSLSKNTVHSIRDR